MEYEIGTLSLTKIHSAATNATSPPFLKLPAEIREQIHSYVLGGKILHVGSGPIHHSHSVVTCAHGENYDEGPEGHIPRFETEHISQYKTSSEAYAHVSSHLRCYLLPYEERHYPLSLLSVCRQI